MRFCLWVCHSDAEDTSRENSAELLSGSCGLEANVHQRRNAIARK